MIKTPHISIHQVSHAISKITLKRAEKSNALNLELMEQLLNAFVGLENSSCQVVILNSKGKHFCSGLDLEQAAKESLIKEMSHHFANLLTFFHSSSLVTIACVQGHAFAGGGGLAAACDIMLLEEESKIGFPETRRGIVAAQVATILIRQISMRHVRELLLTGELITSRRAVEIGLANQIVLPGKMEIEALRIANEILKGAPLAIKRTKNLLEKLEPGVFSHDLDFALSIHNEARVSNEGKEGIASFLEKRSPNWNL